MLSKQEFYKDEKHRLALKQDLELINKAKSETQAEIARREASNSRYFQHCVNVAQKVMVGLDDDNEKLEAENTVLKLENNEYKERHGPLDQETIKKIEESRQLVPIVDKRSRLAARFVKANRELLEKQ
jgi:hypothetical protein